MTYLDALQSYIKDHFFLDDCSNSITVYYALISLIKSCQCISPAACCTRTSVNVNNKHKINQSNSIN